MRRPARLPFPLAAEDTQLGGVRGGIAPAVAAAMLAAALLWLGPPGADLAAHVYQRALFVEHGFTLWNNFWYAGRYSFVTYSILYYPLAAALGIRLLAVIAIAAAVLAFSVVTAREWGLQARWARWSLAIVWPGLAFSAAFPFALGAALALLAIWALQAGRRTRFALLALLTVAASPLAFLLLALALMGIGAAHLRLPSRQSLLVPAAVVLACGGLVAILWRAFPSAGRYPFSGAELAAACTFCVYGIVLTVRVPKARPLASFLGVYLVACICGYLIPSGVGENIARLRYLALPLALLVVSLRRWRPLPVCLVALALAASWNVAPLAAAYVHGRADPSAQPAYWQPAVDYLKQDLGPSYRVEVVDTSGHWGAVYLPEAGIPIARGWYRQDDFPQNEVLYGELGGQAYAAWLRRLAVAYVVLTSSPSDYSARAEAALLESGKSGLRPVFRTPALTIFAVPNPRPIVVGPAAARVVRLTRDTVRLALSAPGTYQIAIRYSPYWSGKGVCIDATADGMMRLVAARAGTVDLTFGVQPGRALSVIAAGARPACG